MSATNRGAKRNKEDYYRTPKYIIRDFSKWAKNNLNLYSCWDSKYASAFDPCAGGDSENPIMPYPEYFRLNQQPIIWTTNDIRNDSSAQSKEDFLTSSYITNLYSTRCDIVISNPPYNQAMQFVKRGLEMVKEGGYVIYLLRLNFFGAQSRREFFQSQMPVYTVVSSKRPCFMKGSSDATEYCHMIWQKGNYPKYSKLYVI